jgi:hypothetical protein
MTVLVGKWTLQIKETIAETWGAEIWGVGKRLKKKQVGECPKFEKMYTIIDKRNGTYRYYGEAPRHYSYLHYSQG